ncbi:MAG: hypothetical protein JXM79_04470 [Sedimentisphaerales bacterium]|nr:hypothetical protein [Sedimentisphaerales bacterium]
MREYRILLIALIISCFISQISYSKVAEPLPLDDPNAVAQMVLSAMKNVQFPKSGRGTATMKTEKYSKDLDGKELTVEFSFEGKNSRTDIFESKEGIKGSRLKSTIISEKYHISLSGEIATINRTRSHYDYCRDFHPEVFMAFKGYQLTKLLGDFVAHPEVNRTVKLDGNGILHIIAQGHVVNPATHDEYDHKFHFAFDTQRALLPVFYCSAMRHEPNDWGRTEAKLEWKKYGSEWYASRVEYGMKPSDTVHRIATIKSFKPNVEIPDEEFTLAGMEIPDGFRVVDRVSGLAYIYTKPEAKNKTQ